MTTAPARPNYRFKRPPLGKQLEAIEQHWHEPAHALLCRPGTGKSKMSLDHAGLQYMAGMIEGVLIVAPNGVHTQWVCEAIPKDLPDSIPWIGGYYSSGMGKTALQRLTKALESRDMGLKVLSISHEGIQTAAGYKLAHRLLDMYRCMVVVDESHRVSNTKSVGYKVVFKAARKGYTRRIATGTLVRQNPFSAYGQFELLGPGLLGFGSLASFRSMFAEMLPADDGLVRKIARDFNKKTGKRITPQIQARDAEDRPIYKNLPYLRKQLERYSTFMSLADVKGTEPVTLLSTRYVRLTPDQRTIYNDLVDLGVADAPGGQLTAEGTLALAIRLAQVTGGFAPSDDNPHARPLPGDNPKLDELLDLLVELGDEKVIVWARFHAEIDLIVDTLRKRFGAPAVVEYHGRVSDADRAQTKHSFINDPRTRLLVGQQKAAGTGLDGLQESCRYMVFYSNDYPYLDREQAIGRILRLGGAGAVNVIDIMAEDSEIDAAIVRCMQTAQDVHEKVLRTAATKRI